MNDFGDINHNISASDLWISETAAETEDETEDENEDENEDKDEATSSVYIVYYERKAQNRTYKVFRPWYQQQILIWWHRWALLNIRPKLNNECEIVLLDTRSEMNNIKCIAIPFNWDIPPYYAISYQRGKYPEWKAQTPNYMASITEISQSNVIRLCELYRSETRYMWIDAICTNQEDKEHRKMAFRNTRIIHESAQRVIEVPDLWYCDGMGEIVLLDTRSEMNNIKCIAIPFNGDIPPYYAISYQRGKYPECKAQTPNYMASITKISQSNVIRLCKLYRSEIQYMWINVICINQADKGHREMTIKNMARIYQNAKRIIEVPDLCYCGEKSEIVLLDTRSEMNNIKCISIPFNEKVPPCYAISYRWGSHPEWKAQTPNYTAFITSISQENLIRLCEFYRSKIRYMWIDVVCINQADKEHRKMAIKIMNSIYPRAERIIAVQDLCYCYGNPLMEDVTKEDIEAALIREYISSKSDWWPWRHIEKLFDSNEPGAYFGFQLELDEVNEKLEKKGTWYDFRDFDDYAEMRLRLSNTEKGREFLSRVIDEWAERAWVISERTIGVNNRKLLIHVLRANAVFYWRLYSNVSWDISISRLAAFRAIFGSKSTKYIDRLFAILPHTDYAYAVQNLVDADVCIDTQDDLTWILFDILDYKGRDDLLRYLIESGDSWCVLPLSREEDEFYFTAKSHQQGMMIQHHIDHLSTGMELTTTPCGKRAVKFSCLVVYNLRSNPLPWIKDNLRNMYIITSEQDSMIYSGRLCIPRNDGWKLSLRPDVILPPFTWKCREFLMFKEN